MASPIEDYALLSDLRTGALVSKHGSIDWLCFPRFDNPSVFASLLGDLNHGRWLLAPLGAPDHCAPRPDAGADPTRKAADRDESMAGSEEPAPRRAAGPSGREAGAEPHGTEPHGTEPHGTETPRRAGALADPSAVGAGAAATPADGGPEVVERTYIANTFVLRTLWRTDSGQVLVTDFMPVGDRRASLVRRVEGLSGSVRMHQELTLRFGYGSVIPWVRREGSARRGGRSIVAVAGPDAIVLHGDRLPRAADHSHAGDFLVSAGETVDFELCWYPSHRNVPERIDVGEALQHTSTYWRRWAADIPEQESYDKVVRRSLLVLRALTHEATGGIVAAPTTSLPEAFGGERNWDYRYCWLRDAALTLESMMTHGYQREALKWRDWLLRAVAGNTEDLQIMYGLGGERRLPERDLDLPGYAASVPVRVGNGAVTQYQGDVVGEVMVALEKLRNMGQVEDHFSWPLQKSLVDYVAANFDRKDHGIWEMRGDKKYFTHSRVMMWATFDRAVRAVVDHGLEGDADPWRKMRDLLRDEVMEHGFNRELNTFTQTYGSTEVDASLLVLAQVGFVDYDSPEMAGTVARLEHDLMDEAGLLHRYRTQAGMDGLPPGEYPFLACSFWLVEQYARSGRIDDARRLMDRLVGTANDLGLMAEEYDTVGDRMAGNFPQAFSHLALIRAADAINGHGQTAL